MKEIKETCNSGKESKKIYVKGNLYDIEVGMREVELTDTIVEGKREGNVLLDYMTHRERSEMKILKQILKMDCQE